MTELSISALQEQKADVEFHNASGALRVMPWAKTAPYHDNIGNNYKSNFHTDHSRLMSHETLEDLKEGDDTP